MTNINWYKVNLSDPRVAAYLAAATDTKNEWRNKVRLDRNGSGKTSLRVHKTADGRFYVRCGFRGNGRSYLANKCEITTIEGGPEMFLFYLEMYEQEGEQLMMF